MDYHSKSLSRYISNVRTERLVNFVSPNQVANIVCYHGSITTNYNNQFRQLFDSLNTERLRLDENVKRKLKQKSDYTGCRSKGVELARKYEIADLKMGGTGSSNYTKEECDQILKTGTVPGEGHHINNVTDHLEHQANPDNIKFYPNRRAHLDEAHGGNFKNKTNGEFIDKGQMLRNTNIKRVVKNEIYGAAKAFLIVFCISFTISAIVELSRKGIDDAELKNVFINSFNPALKDGAVAAFCYGAGRLAEKYIRENGKSILSGTGKAASVCSIIFLLSTIEFIKLKRDGVATKEAMRQTGYSALIELGVFFYV